MTYSVGVSAAIGQIGAVGEFGVWVPGVRGGGAVLRTPLDQVPKAGAYFPGFSQAGTTAVMGFSLVP